MLLVEAAFTRRGSIRPPRRPRQGFQDPLAALLRSSLNCSPVKAFARPKHFESPCGTKPLTAPTPGSDGAYRVKATKSEATAPEQEAPDDRAPLPVHGRSAVRPLRRVTVEDLARQRGRACPHHAVQALNGLVGATVIWGVSRGINEHEITALTLAQERSQLAGAGPLVSH